jgi:hypothetical protein
MSLCSEFTCSVAHSYCDSTHIPIYGLDDVKCCQSNADHNTDTHAITVTHDDPEGAVPPPPVQEEGEEPVIHIQAVAALAKICGSEDLEDLGEGEQTATELLEDQTN